MMRLGALRESVRRAILRRSVPRSVFAACFSLPSSVFYHKAVGFVLPLKTYFVLCLSCRSELGEETEHKARSTSTACVAERQKHLTVDQTFVINFVGSSPTACTKRKTYFVLSFRKFTLSGLIGGTETKNKAQS